MTRPADALPLARVVPTLAPETLHALIRHRGLDAATELVAAATPQQLTAVVDIDLWRRASSRDDRFDVERFGEWVEALADAGDEVAVQTICALDADLFVAGLSRYIRVLDPATLLPTVCSEEAADFDAPVFGGLSREIGGYLVRARTSDAWDAIVDLLFALREHRFDRFEALLRGCRRLSNSTPEIDGLDDLLLEPEQLMHDVAADRARRRSHQGYVTPADARAFLLLARTQQHQAGPARSVNPVAAAHFRDSTVDPLQDRVQPASAPQPARVETDPEMAAAVAALLEDAGLVSSRPRALLTASSETAIAPTRVEVMLRATEDEALIAVRTRELAFLANVLMSGTSIASRPFTPQEASDGALAICNLGLEQRAHAAADPDTTLVAAFETGWAALHDLVMFVARQLIEALDDLQCSDDDIQAGLAALRRDLLRECANGTPWHAASALDVLSMLDMPVCLCLQSLIAECPVFPDALAAILERRKGRIDPAAFEFISTAELAGNVRKFAKTLLDALTR